jgi:hypothetical protein
MEKQHGCTQQKEQCVINQAYNKTQRLLSTERRAAWLSVQQEHEARAAGSPALLVVVVEHECDASLSDASLPLLVHKLLQVAYSHLAQIADAQHKADRVEDVGLAAAIEPSDSVEVRVEAAQHCACGV